MDPEHEEQERNELEDAADNASEETESIGVDASTDDRLSALEGELADAQTGLQERDERVSQLQAELGATLERYRALLLAANPDVPPEAVQGASIAELDASFHQAEALVERLRRQVEERVAQERVPAGAPPRRSPDVSALTPQQKIQLGLQRQTG